MTEKEKDRIIWPLPIPDGMPQLKAQHLNSLQRRTCELIMEGKLPPDYPYMGDEK